MLTFYECVFLPFLWCAVRWSIRDDVLSCTTHKNKQNYVCESNRLVKFYVSRHVTQRTSVAFVTHNDWGVRGTCDFTYVTNKWKN